MGDMKNHTNDTGNIYMTICKMQCLVTLQVSVMVIDVQTILPANLMKGENKNA